MYKFILARSYSIAGHFINKLWKKRVKIVEIGRREFYFVLQTETISRVFRNVNRANSEVVSLLLTSSVICSILIVKLGWLEKFINRSPTCHLNFASSCDSISNENLVTTAVNGI
ncbi:hypothetical protein T01_14464 [Trichinella spiralis]|uniref:Uncharacterized protein n=1 Tax=Trichinella spiralis TaxID=6334 RepID=A0A0V1BJC7_TRISP|nr:hypothetical protein T01_14464 [Trichinella spiralis]